MKVYKKQKEKVWDFTIDSKSLKPYILPSKQVSSIHRMSKNIILLHPYYYKCKYDYNFVLKYPKKRKKKTRIDYFYKRLLQLFIKKGLKHSTEKIFRQSIYNFLLLSKNKGKDLNLFRKSMSYIIPKNIPAFKFQGYFKPGKKRGKRRYLLYKAKAVELKRREFRVYFWLAKRIKSRASRYFSDKIIMEITNIYIKRIIPNTSRKEFYGSIDKYFRFGKKPHHLKFLQ